MKHPRASTTSRRSDAMPVEIAIRGAGPVGCVLALLLQGAGSRVVLHDARGDSPAAGQPAFRPLALSHASRLILERAGAWQDMSPTPIETIHVSRRDGFGRVLLSAADAGVPALGYVLDYRVLLDALLRLVRLREIPLSAAAPDASLVVHAEGTAAGALEKDHRQEAVTALIAVRPAARGIAWERFTPEGPLALLPLGEEYCAVWGTSPARARSLCEAPELEFLEALAREFGHRAGNFVSVSRRGRTPLAPRVRPSRVAERAVYIGNAAQTLHPVAGQGLNLGLRDAWDLARALEGAADPGAARVLDGFSRSRRVDAAATVRTTDFLARAFLGTNPLTGFMRGFGLTALDICPPARRFFARRMIYGVSALP
jgi:2-octaprenyl-6-methoxyphenol hydroxylase